jgi:hypothetical protein
MNVVQVRRIISLCKERLSEINKQKENIYSTMKWVRKECRHPNMKSWKDMRCCDDCGFQEDKS